MAAVHHGRERKRPGANSVELRRNHSQSDFFCSTASGGASIVTSTAAGLQLAHQDLLAEIHRSPSADREEQGRHRVPVLEPRQ
jgi:hypothetical protein